MKHEKKEDQDNFYDLFRRYYAPFCLYAQKIIPDEEICKDVVSDVFAMLWDKRHEFELKSETTIAYIKICVRNSCLNYLKHQDCELDFEEYYKKNTPLYEDNTESVYTLDELYKMLYESLNKLPPNYREVFVKTFYEGKTRDVIAQELNISTKSVYRYKSKVIELLKEQLKSFILLLPFLSLCHHF